MLEMTNSFQVERARMTQWLEQRVKRAEKDVVTETVTLTPVLASLLLERNEVNRKVSDAVVDTYSRDMMAGRWQLNGESVIVAKDGLLNDGQHRCLAVIRCEKAVSVVMVFGVEHDTRFTVDQGKIRTAGDYVGMHGYKDANCTATVAGYIWQWKERGRLSGGGGNMRGTKSEPADRAERAAAQAGAVTLATYREALATVFRLTGVGNGGVTVRRLSSRCGAAYVEDLRGNVVALTAFDWGTVTDDMRDRPVEMMLAEEFVGVLA